MDFSEGFNSLKETIKTKTTNPFFGTLIIVWLYEHWEMFYKLFNFEYGTKLQVKIDYLLTWLSPWAFTRNMLLCIAITFLVLIGSFILINIARYISNIFENRVTPWVSKKSAPKDIVPIEKYKKEVSLKEDLQNKLFEIKSNLDSIQKENDGLEKENGKLVSEYASLQNLSNNTNHQKDKEKEEILNKLYDLRDLSENFSDLLYKKHHLRMEVDIFARFLEGQKLTKDFIEICNLIEKSKKLNKPVVINPNDLYKFVLLGLIERDVNSDGELVDGGYEVVITHFGNTIRNFTDKDKKLEYRD